MGSVTTGVAGLRSGVGQRSAEDIGVPNLVSPLTQRSGPGLRKPPVPIQRARSPGTNDSRGLSETAASAESGHIYGPAVRKSPHAGVAAFVNVRLPPTVSLHGGRERSSRVASLCLPCTETNFRIFKSLKKKEMLTFSIFSAAHVFMLLNYHEPY